MALLSDRVVRPRNWGIAVSAAYLRLIGLTIAESAKGAGCGARTLKRWEASPWWTDACEEATDSLAQVFELILKPWIDGRSSLDVGSVLAMLTVMQTAGWPGAKILGDLDQLERESSRAFPGFRSKAAKPGKKRKRR